MQLQIPTDFLRPFTTPFSLMDYKQRLQDFATWSKDNFNLYPVQHLVKARSEFVDFVLNQVWQSSDLATSQDLALVAVGGYGRGELHPESDIDLLLLSNKPVNQDTADKISQFLTALWDLKFDVGHAVRTVKDTLAAGKEDIQTATNLMERRLICGNSDTFTQLCQALTNKKFISSQDFYLAKRQEQEQRHARYHSTSYNLEPNLKANPGCLRDLQTISWVAKKHFDTQNVEDLVRNEYMKLSEYRELEECQDYLWQMRFALHVVAGRSENRLLFDYQPLVAEYMGFGDDGKAAVERMMKRFFRVARRVIELNTMLLQRFNSAILGTRRDVTIIDDDFVIHGRSLLVRHDDVFFNRSNMIKMFIHVAEYEQIEKLHSSTIRLLRMVRRRLMGDLHDIARCRDTFIEFLRHPRAMGRAFSLMLKHSILAYYMPNWRHIVGQMQFDLFHAYTVDEHTHRLLKNLYRFTKDEFADEFPLCSQIMKRIDKPELLYMAGIFHDIGKGRGGDHSELGAIDASNFGQLHKLPKADTELVSWLVEHHLLMSVTAQKNDIYDPDVIAEFARKVKDETRLKYLYCLTVADVRATNSNLWNDWKNTLMADLYLATRRALRNGLENAKTMRETASSNKEQALELFDLSQYPQQDIEKIWRRFRTLYFARHAPKHIHWHTMALLTNNATSKQPVVLISETSVRGGTQVFVYGKDRTGLLADIVSTFDSKNVNVVDAHIMDTKNGYVADTFIILEQDNSLIESQTRRDAIAKALSTVITGEQQAPSCQRRVPRQIKQFTIPVKVRFMDSNSKKRDMIEITALDTPGLLAKIANVFKEQAITLFTAKISTIGEKAEDIFKVANSQGEKLSEQEQETLTNALIAALE